MVNGDLTREKFEELVRGKQMSKTVTPENVFDQGKHSTHYRVKDPSESYDETRFSSKHCKTGQPVFDPIYQRECLSENLFP